VSGEAQRVGPGEPRLSAEERASLARGVAQFNDRLFFECHDTLEDLWAGLRGDPRDLVQGLIQAAVGFHHLSNGNRPGAITLFDRAEARLARYPDGYGGIALDALREAVARFRTAVASGAALPPEGPPRIAFVSAPPARRVGRRELFAALAPHEPEGGHWIRVHRPAMACRFEVVLSAEDASHVGAARAALDEIDAIEHALTWFRETSELSRLNREAAASPVPVDPSLFELLALCGELFEATGGAFDPTSTPLSRAWGFLDRAGRVPSPEALTLARASTGFGHVRLDTSRRTVSFDRAGVELNLGSIGKGWALDRIAGGLRARGVPRALLTAGGSSQRGWGGGAFEVALTSRGEELGTLRLRDAALGTSGPGEQGFEADGRRFGHVLDPRTGWPAAGVRSATAVADDAAVADALATAFLVGGEVVARRYCGSHRGTVGILALDEDPGTLRVYGEREGIAVEAAPARELLEETRQ
jgi:thiamine biosynthesis lipoprotein